MSNLLKKVIYSPSIFLYGSCKKALFSFLTSVFGILFVVSTILFLLLLCDLYFLNYFIPRSLDHASPCNVVDLCSCSRLSLIPILFIASIFLRNLIYFNKAVPSYQSIKKDLTFLNKIVLFCIPLCMSIYISAFLHTIVETTTISSTCRIIFGTLLLIILPRGKNYFYECIQATKWNNGTDESTIYINELEEYYKKCYLFVFVSSFCSIIAFLIKSSYKLLFTETQFVNVPIMDKIEINSAFFTFVGLFVIFFIIFLFLYTYVSTKIKTPSYDPEFFSTVAKNQIYPFLKKTFNPNNQVLFYKVLVTVFIQLPGRYAFFMNPSLKKLLKENPKNQKILLHWSEALYVMFYYIFSILFFGSILLSLFMQISFLCWSILCYLFLLSTLFYRAHLLFEHISEPCIQDYSLLCMSGENPFFGMGHEENENESEDGKNGNEKNGTTNNSTKKNEHSENSRQFHKDSKQPKQNNEDPKQNNKDPMKTIFRHKTEIATPLYDITMNTALSLKIPTLPIAMFAGGCLGVYGCMQLYYGYLMKEEELQTFKESEQDKRNLSKAQTDASIRDLKKDPLHLFNSQSPPKSSINLPIQESIFAETQMSKYQNAQMELATLKNTFQECLEQDETSSDIKTSTTRCAHLRQAFVAARIKESQLLTQGLRADSISSLQTELIFQDLKSIEQNIQEQCEKELQEELWKEKVQKNIVLADKSDTSDKSDSN